MPRALACAPARAINFQLAAFAVDPEVAQVVVTAVNYGRLATTFGAGVASTTGRVQRSQLIKYAALTGQKVTIGEVQVTLSRAMADATIARFSRDVLIAAGAGVIFLCCATFIFLWRMVGRPVKRSREWSTASLPATSPPVAQYIRAMS